MILDHCDKKCHNLRTSVVISYWRLETRGLGVGSHSVFGWFHSYTGQRIKKEFCTLRKLDRFLMRYFLLHNRRSSAAIKLTALLVY